MVTFADSSTSFAFVARHARGQSRRSINSSNHQTAHRDSCESSNECHATWIRLVSSSRDPIGYHDGASLYSGYFAPNNLDPSGLSWGWNDFFIHYYTGHGSAVTLSEIGLADIFESYFKSRIDGHVTRSLSRAKAIPTHCDNGPGSYSKSQNTKLPREVWNGYFHKPLTPLGKVSMFINAFERKHWRCERCCTRVGDQLKVVWWHAETDVFFSMADAFTNPYGSGGNPYGPGWMQGVCINNCWKKFGSRTGGYVPCKNACILKYPTKGDDGVPFGIFHGFSRNASDSVESPCGSEWP